MGGGTLESAVTDRIRVLHIITRLEPGGAQRNTLYTVAHLDRRQFDVGLAWGPGDPLDPEAEAIDDLWRDPVVDLVRRVAPASDARATGRLRRAVRAFRPDVVHTHSSKAGVVGRLAASLEGVPAIVHSIHGFGFTPLQPAPVRALFFAAEKLAARWTHHFIAVSRRNLELGLELGLYRPKRVSLIRSGIDLERFRAGGDTAQVRRRLGVPEGAPLVTQVGNFKPQKAPLDFVRAAAAIAAHVPEAWFVMVGDGVLRRSAERLARQLGLAGRLLFPGWWQDIPGLLSATEVSVLSSRHEGLPRVLIEAAACSRPVLATRVGGVPEAVEDGTNGYLVPPGDPEALAGRWTELLENAELRQSFGLAGRRLVEERFGLDVMMDKLHRILEELAAQEPHPAGG